MSQLTIYTNAISTTYPDLPITSAHFPSQAGQYNDIVIVNGALVFRFPRHEVGRQTIENEVKILTHIQGQTTLPVPNPRFVNLTAPLGSCFMGYGLLPGRALQRDTLAAITDEQVLQRLASQLAEFLIELHGIPAGSLTLPFQETVDEFVRFFAEVQTHLYPFMRPDARVTVTQHFEDYLNAPDLQQFRPVIRHGDFGTGNILYDPHTMAISGIIDFGFAGLGDPAIDVAAASTLGQPFFSHFRPLYPNIEPLLARARFYRGTYALYEALHGFKNNDQTAFNAGMALYK